MASSPIARFTPEQYLEMDRRALVKSEYYHGEIFAMAGASWAHSVVVSNFNGLCNAQIQDGPCQAVTNDLRVQVGAAYYYPNVVVICGSPEFTDSHTDTALNPTVIVEVLSPSTEAYDRGLKFVEYRRISSLREYVLIAQDVMRVELYTRQHDNRWLLSELSQPDDVLRLTSVGCAIPLAALYRNVPFPVPPEVSQ